VQNRLLVSLLLIGCSGGTASAGLNEYVAKEDKSYRWEKRATYKVPGFQCAELRLISQTWRGITWKHRLFVALPETRDIDAEALLIIGGGRWRDRYEQPHNPDDPTPKIVQSTLIPIALQASMPVALLEHVPFQPMFDGKVEDQIISLTFAKYLETGEADWPLLLPMVKSAVRAMDTIQDFADTEWNVDIENFTVTGGSKRGWTTWLTGAADPRVNAIAPMVIDVLNMGPQMRHQLEAWGQYSEQIGDYTERGIQDQQGTARSNALNGIVDPYSYRRVLTMPKLIIIGTNDRYWPLDALNLYWDGLIGEKHILYVPNQGHGVTGDRVRPITGATSLARQAAGKMSFGDFEWTLAEDDKALTLSIYSNRSDAQVTAWVATSDTRDFRDAEWKPTRLEADGRNYTYTLPRPSKGYAAMFGEVVETDGKHSVFRSTNVKILRALPGWKTLLDGRDLAGWHAGSPGAEHTWCTAGSVGLDADDRRKLAASPGKGVLVNGPTGRTQDFYSDELHGDCELHVEFLVAEHSNSGVYFMGRYEVQILDSFGETELSSSDCGGIYQRWINEKGVDGRPPDFNASKRPGQWQSFDVIFRAPKFDKSGKKITNAKFEKVIHNDVVIHENVELKGPTRGGTAGPEIAKGPLRIQGDHGPVAYRNIRIKHLK